MYKTCKYCGVVDEGHICPYKIKHKKSKRNIADRFRKTKAWTAKSIEIRKRDRYLCQVCEANLYNTIWQLNYMDLDVHHIVKVNEDYNKRLDNGNLITLCRYHHKMADNGEIPKDVLIQLVKHPPRGSK